MEFMKKSLDFILLDDEAASSAGVARPKKKKDDPATVVPRFKLKKKTKVRSGMEERKRITCVDPIKHQAKVDRYRSKLEEKHKNIYGQILKSEMERINGPKVALAKYYHKKGHVLGPEMHKKRRKPKKNAPFFTDADFKKFEASMKKPKKKELSLEDDD